MKKIGMLVLGLLLISSLSMAQETRTLSSFKDLDIGGAFKVELKKTGQHKITIDADADDLERIVTDVSGSKLKVYYKGSMRFHRSEIRMVIEFAELESIDLSGASTVTCDDVVEASSFEIDASGAGSLRMEVRVKDLEAELSGAGSVTLSGRADKQRVDMSGAGTYRAEDMDCDYTDVEISGAGSARVVANKELRAESSGAGSVRYRGNPDKVYADSNGAGSVRKMN